MTKLTMVPYLKSSSHRQHVFLYCADQSCDLDQSYIRCMCGHGKQDFRKKVGKLRRNSQQWLRPFRGTILRQLKITNNTSINSMQTDEKNKQNNENNFRGQNIRQTRITRSTERQNDGQTKQQPTSTKVFLNSKQPSRCICRTANASSPK